MDSSGMVRVGLITKLWGRPALTRLFFEYWDALVVPGAEFVKVAAFTKVEDGKLAQGFGWLAEKVPNEPLAAKGNAACRLLRGEDVDLAINLGSDDFASPGYILECCEMVQAGSTDGSISDYLLPRELYVYNAPTRECTYIWNNHSLTAGAALSRRLLEEVGYAPWNPQGHRPDTDMQAGLYKALRRLGGSGYPDMVTGAGAVVDVKTDEGCYWPGGYEGVKTGGGFRRQVDGPQVLQTYFPFLDEKLCRSEIGVRAGHDAR